MKAMVLIPGHQSLQYFNVAEPRPAAYQILIRVAACGICCTDLHVIDGELPNPKLPLVPGHEVVGRVVRCGDHATKFNVGDRVGVPWLAQSCGECQFCKAEQENLCDQPLFTGYTVDGGYAEYLCANENFCFLLPEGVRPKNSADANSP
jgi:alcohol dehydrogenase, propanol-preferring